VLVAEDEADHRAWLSALLRQQGFDVAEAHDGRELLEMLLMVPPWHFDLVVCDQMMPGMKGTEVLACASSRATWIIVTAWRNAGVEPVADQFGALGVLHKPFETDALRRLIERASKHARESGTHRRITRRET
jgi:DNA-binding NtrC family response regulator